MTRVLVVDDEPQIRRSLDINLRTRGYDVDLAADGEAALQIAAKTHPDLVLLDLGLPGIDGVAVIEGLRGWTAVPIIVLSVRDAEHDKVAALDAGADDYVTKPFGMDELLARVRAAVRRTTGAADEPAVITTPHFQIDLQGRRLSTADGPVRLTPTEWHIVELLARNDGRLLTARQIIRDVWGPGYESDTTILRVHLTHIRRKLEPQPSRPRYFQTEPGMGYRFMSGSSTD